MNALAIFELLQLQCIVVRRVGPVALAPVLQRLRTEKHFRLTLFSSPTPVSTPQL